MCDEWEAFDNETGTTGLGDAWVFGGKDGQPARQVYYYPLWQDLYRAAYVLAKRAKDAAKRAETLSGPARVREQWMAVRYAAPAIPLAAASLESYLNACIEVAYQAQNLAAKHAPAWERLRLPQKTGAVLGEFVPREVLDFMCEWYGTEDVREYLCERVEALWALRNGIVHHRARPAHDGSPPSRRNASGLRPNEGDEHDSIRVITGGLDYLRRMGVTAEGATAACNLVVDIAEQIHPWDPGMPSLFRGSGPPRLDRLTPEEFDRLIRQWVSQHEETETQDRETPG